MTKEKVNISNKIIIPSKVWGAKKEELLKNLEWISQEDIQKAVEKMERLKKKRLQKEEKEKLEKEEKEKKEEKDGIKPELLWDGHAILEDLRKNHVKFGNHVEMLGEVGQIVHLDLPAVWNFKWFKFDYFVSERDIYKKDFDKQKRFEEQSYSSKEIIELLKAMNEYMQEYWVSTYEDFEQYKNEWHEIYNTTERYLRVILGLYKNYRMKDGYKRGLLSSSRTSWMLLSTGYSKFEGIKKGYSRLLLKLSDYTSDYTTSVNNK